MHWQFSMAGNGNIYYAANGNIYFSELKDNIYQDPLKLDSCINTSYSECTPYINPEENLLIFARSANGKPDLYISRKDKSGNWLPSKQLQNGINSEHHEMCPRVTADGKYFFFISSREGLFSAYWVDAKVIEKY
jgi:Tol biopolymer transport system component